MCSCWPRSRAPTTGEAADADPARRVGRAADRRRAVVRPVRRAVRRPADERRGRGHRDRVGRADALPFPLCISVEERPGCRGEAWGNIVLADHGRTIAGGAARARCRDSVRVGAAARLRSLRPQRAGAGPDPLPPEVDPRAIDAGARRAARRDRRRSRRRRARGRPCSPTFEPGAARLARRPRLLVRRRRRGRARAAHACGRSATAITVALSCALDGGTLRRSRGRRRHRTTAAADPRAARPGLTSTGC